MATATPDRIGKDTRTSKETAGRGLAFQSDALAYLSTSIGWLEAGIKARRTGNEKLGYVGWNYGTAMRSISTDGLAVALEQNLVYCFV